MSINKEYKNIAKHPHTSYNLNNKNTVKDKKDTVKGKIIYNKDFINQTIEDQFRRNTSKHKSDSSDNTKSISLTSYYKVGEAMGLGSLFLSKIKRSNNKYLNLEEYEKIKQFFQEHLSPNSTNHLEPFHSSKLSDFFPGKLKIEESLLRKIMHGVDEIIENETHINHPEKSDSNNNKRCINVTNEENPLDQKAFEHSSKKVKITATKCLLSASQENVDDLFHTIPDEPFLPEEPSLSSTNQASSALFLLDDLLLPSSIANDAFPLENTWEDKTTSECQLSAPQQNVDDLFYTIPDELFLPEEPSLSSTNQASSAPFLLDNDLLLPSSTADDVFPLENTWDDDK